MRNQIIWLPLYLGVATGKNIKKLVRIRGDPGTYYNTSSESVTSSSSTASITSDLPSLTPGDRSSDDLSTSTFFPSGTPDSSVSACIDTTVTYTDTIPPTVYITVDGSYEVTVTASNASMTAQPVMETPPPACMTTIIPPPDEHGPVWSVISLSAETTQSAATFHSLTAGTHPRPSPEVPGTVTGPINLRYTSTVYVTKKTPVPVVQDPSTQPPVTFERPGPGASHTIDSNPSPSANPNAAPTAKSEVIMASKTNDNTASNGINRATDGNVIPTHGSNSPGSPNDGSSQAPGDSLTRGIASIIASVINSPFMPPHPAQDAPGFAAVPATTTIAGVPVTVGSSNVVIGTNDVPLPTNSPAIVVFDGNTFTVKSDEILAPGTTFKIAIQQSAVPTITQAASTVTAAGVTLTVDAHQAIISGTTYRIGNGAKPTTVVVNGQTISIGSDGVGFAGIGHTTFAPAMTIAGDYEIVAADGLTVSVDQTDAVINGKTYRIGAGATSTTVVVDGKTISIGPGGVSLASTTIPPTSIPSLSTTHASSGPSSTQATATNTNGSQGTSNGSRTSYFLTDSKGWLFALLSIVCILF